MKSLIENTGCKYALTTSAAPNRHPFGHTIGPSYPHLFCGEPTVKDGVYCAEHHKLCRRGQGKDARSLEEMIYAVDQSQYRGKSAYADHTDPIDIELRQEKAA
jgi:hypothetical protein